MVDVCLFIDPLFDFLDAKGRYAEIFGVEETVNVRACSAHIDALFAHCRATAGNTKIVLVTSVYKPDQFEGAPNICITPKGREFMIRGVDNSSIYVNSSPEHDDILVVTKTQNSVLHCDKAAELLTLIRGKHVLLCGVTSTSCIQSCAMDLCAEDRCASVSIGLNSVGCRRSKGDERMFLKERFANCPKVTLYDSWESAVGKAGAGLESR